MNSKSTILALVILLSLAAPALAQTPAAAPQTEEQRQAQKELERKTLGMLDEVIKDSESFKHAENRVRVRASAAFILWKHDEPRARALFREAIASLTDILEDGTAENTTDARRVFDGPQQLRVEMLQMLAQRDARMARELLRASRSAPTQASSARGMREDFDRQQDLNLAMEIASTDPKLAADIARDSLSQGLHYQLPTIVAATRATDPEVAARLAADIMAKLRSEKLDSNRDARTLALGLLRVVTQTSDSDSQAGARIVTPLLDQMSIRELTEMVTTEALRAPAQNGDMLASLQSMMSVVEKYAPGRVEQLRASAPKKTEDGGEEDGLGEPNDWSKYAQLFEKGSADELLAAAPKAPAHMREMFYQQAAMKLLVGGDPERARQIINEKIENPTQREQLLRELEKTAAVTAAASGKLEDSRKILATLKTAEQRAILLVELSSGALAKGDRKIALLLLDEARSLVARRAKNVNQLAAQLLVARGYAQLDPSRGLAMLEPIVDQLNELLAAATVLGGFFMEELVQDDEIMLGPLSMLTNLGLLHPYLGDITALASADFDRTKALVDKFQRDEIRTLMRLIVAQSILSPTPTTSPIEVMTTTNTIGNSP